jgi:hypothetical protein
MWVSTFGMASRKSDEAAAVDFIEMKLVPGKGNMPNRLARLFSDREDSD